MDVKVGDKVTRMLVGTLPMELVVTEVTDDRIKCGDWEFDRTYGYEIDEELGWGVRGAQGFIETGSFIVQPDAK
jgi:hypothetical protein